MGISHASVFHCIGLVYELVKTQICRVCKTKGIDTSRTVLCLFCNSTCRTRIYAWGGIYEWLTKGWQGYGLWFIPVLFIALLLSKIIMSAASNRVHLVFAIILMAVGASLKYVGISLPWTLASVPYATALIILGAKMKSIMPYIEYPRWWILALGFVVTCLISHFWRLDIAWNTITPVTLLTVGAVAGTLMMFTFSAYIVKYTKFTSRILQVVGKETYIILAFSQISIMLMNTYFPVNSIIKYCALIALLIIIKYLKDAINKLLNFKLL